MLNKKYNHQIEDELFVFLQKGSKSEQLEKLMEKHHLSQAEMNELIMSHYYLAPRNITKAQLLLALLAFILPITFTAVRSNNDWGIILISALVGAFVGFPYVLFYLLIKKTPELPMINILSIFSFAYSLLAGLLFMFTAIDSQLYGATLIPLIVFAAYGLEIIKLRKLLKKLQDDGSKSK